VEIQIIFHYQLFPTTLSTLDLRCISTSAICVCRSFMAFITRKNEAVAAFESRDIERSISAHLLPPLPAEHEEPTLAQGKYAKPFVFGALDGLATIFALVAGSVGADLAAESLLAVGVGNLIAGALGMGIGEYVSSKADRDVALREEARERWEVENNAEGEVYEMVQIYESKGVATEDAIVVARILSKYPKFWVEHMMLTEIGMLPADENESPALSGLVMFLSFVIFGSVPLLSYYLLSFGGIRPFTIATLSSVFTLFVLGAIKSRFVSKPALTGGFVMVLQGGLCAFSAYCLGDMINSLLSS
jgi:VIT1/CCC1 family predicted Fe2+/Mn2+ transporter